MRKILNLDIMIFTQKTKKKQQEEQHAFFFFFQFVLKVAFYELNLEENK